MVGGPEEGSGAVRRWSRLVSRSASDVRLTPRPTYRPMLILPQNWRLETGVRVACGWFWGLGGRSAPSGPLKTRGARSGGLGRTPGSRFLVIC